MSDKVHEMMKILPESWFRVVMDRRAKWKDETLKSLRAGNVGEECLDCPCARLYNYRDYIRVTCVFDKCIKQYPVYSDNEEFK